jgi:hypothetical protein
MGAGDEGLDGQSKAWRVKDIGLVLTGPQILRPAAHRRVNDMGILVHCDVCKRWVRRRKANLTCR